MQVEGLNKQCSGTISEIVPEAQSASRTFQVKVTGPCPTGVYSGMFGRILIALQEEQVLVIPRQAVRNVGQLDLVEVREDGRVSRRDPHRSDVPSRRGAGAGRVARGPPIRGSALGLAGGRRGLAARDIRRSGGGAR